jgi:heat shock protein HslJ
MNLTHSAVAALLAVAALAACTAVPTGPDQSPLDGTAWVLARLPGQTLLAEAKPTAQFEGGRVQGTDGCNRYTAPYTASGGTLQVGARGASTMMACAPAVMKQAEAFMGALTRAARYRVAEGELELAAADGTVLAAFAAQPRTLAGTAWRVTNFNNGRQAVVSVLAGTNLTLAFAADGRASGSAGCNNYTGGYRADGPKLTIGPVAATRRMCPAPQGIMEQEQQFLKMLESVATARFEGDRLELRTADGALAAILLWETPK